MNRYFYCYSYPLKEFFKKNGLSYITAAQNKTTLSLTFDLSNINWSLCDMVGQKSIVKEACDLYMSGVTTLQHIGNILQVHRATVRKYLKRGEKLGWCNYTAANGREQAHLSCMKPIVLVDSNENIIYKFDGAQDCAKQMEYMYKIYFSRNSISIACRTHKPYKGFNFRYANETTQN